MGNMHLATVAIIAANVLVSKKGFKDYSFFEKYKFNKTVLSKKRLLSKDKIFELFIFISKLNALNFIQYQVKISFYLYQLIYFHQAMTSYSLIHHPLLQFDGY